MIGLKDIICAEGKPRPAFGLMSRHQSVEKQRAESPDIILGAAGLH